MSSSAMNKRSGSRYRSTARTGDGDASVGGDADCGHVTGMAAQLVLDVASIEIPDQEAGVV